MRSVDGTVRRDVRVLFVCFADSVHAHSWMDLLAGSDVAPRSFAVMVLGDGLCGGMYDPIPWRFPMYTTVPPLVRRKDGMSRPLLPDLPGIQRLGQWGGPRWDLRSRWLRLGQWADARWNLRSRWLRRTILRWKPHIVHSLATRPAGVFTWEVLAGLPRALRPRWVVSSWGSDLNLGLEQPEVRPYLEKVLRNCDGFLADCQRDLGKALRAGLDPAKVVFSDALPANGGFAPNAFPLRRTEAPRRDVVLVMKAFDTGVNDPGKVLEALGRVEPSLDGYEIHLMMCSPAVEALVGRLPETLRARIRCHRMMPPEPFEALLGRTRVMVAPSTSDGTPISMLEAMGVGALPLFSPIESIKEWIADGVNGVLARAGDVGEIAAALHRSLTDDALFRRAAEINRRLVLERGNRDTVRRRVLAFYRAFAATAPNVPRTGARAA